MEDYGEIMARGLPDDSNVVKESAVYALSDMAELAARLGSPVNYVRFGDVYMMDEFTHGLGAWGSAVMGGGGFARLTGSHWRSKGVCAHLQGGLGATPYTYMWRWMPIPGSDKMGYCLTFASEDNCYDMQIGLLVTIGEVQYPFKIMIELSTNRFYYWVEPGPWEEFDRTPIGGRQWMFHLCKLVVNLKKREYVRFYFNERSYPLSGILCGNKPNLGAADRCECEVTVTGTNLALGDLYVDDAVVTQNEV